MIEVSPDMRVLAELLTEIEEHDSNYAERYPRVIHAMSCAVALGFDTGIGFDPDEDDYPVVYIELPTGQVSWHMPEHITPWDGHSTEEKYARCQAFTRSVP